MLREQRFLLISFTFKMEMPVPDSFFTQKTDGKRYMVKSKQM